MKAHPDVNEAVTAATPTNTNKMAVNAVAAKRRVFDGPVVGFAAISSATSTGGTWQLTQVGGFPLPFFVIRTMLAKYNVELAGPQAVLEEVVLDPERDMKESISMYSPKEPGWLFLPWFKPVFFFIQQTPASLLDPACWIQQAGRVG